MFRMIALLLILTTSTWFKLEEPVQLEVQGVTIEVREIEVVVVRRAPFKVPSTARTLQLLENRMYYDGYWCSYPAAQDHWFCGPMDGSQMHCQYFPDERLHECYDNFSDETGTKQPW